MCAVMLARIIERWPTTICLQNSTTGLWVAHRPGASRLCVAL